MSNPKFREQRMLPDQLRNLFKAPHQSADARDIAAATAALGVKPFQFFQLAYREWYGVEAQTKVLERAFVDFLYTETAPHWACQFARLVLLQAERGRLDRTAYGLAPPAPEILGPGELRFWSYTVCGLAAGFIWFCVPILRTL